MNREIVIPGGAGVYPLRGDVQSQAGNAQVTVTGLRNVPVLDTFLNGGEVLTYDPNLHNWVPMLRATIMVNNTPVSNDAVVTVNVDKPILVNGA